MLGAGSMVCVNVPAHSTAVGVPAKILIRKTPQVNANDNPGMTMDASLLFYEI